MDETRLDDDCRVCKTPEGLGDTAMFLCMELYRWDQCEIAGLPQKCAIDMDDGSIGFIPIFDDVDKLKKTHPDSEIMVISKGCK